MRYIDRMDTGKAAKGVLRESMETAGQLAGGAIGAELGSLGYHIVEAMVETTREPDSHFSWSPTVPADLHLAKLPPLDADGMAACRHCATKRPFAELDIADNAYTCRPCALEATRAAAAQVAARTDVETVSVRAVWWRWPLVATVLLAAGIAFAVVFAW